MNKVNARCEKDSCAKFYYASRRMYFELKIFRVTLYIISMIPIILTFIPAINENKTLSFLYTLISFFLTIINELLTAFMNNHKEKAVLESQLYEAEITGSTFSKIEYDRESTNDINELAIRKGLPKMRKINKYNIINVPQDISDDYSYLYLCRKNASTTRFLLERINVIYSIILSLIVCIFAGCMFIKTETMEYLQLIIGFYPLVIPIIRACSQCKKCIRQCVKISADIDNFFADGDASIERLARFYYYAQNIEFEMLTMRPTIYNIFNIIFDKRMQILQDGVTSRFIDAINELKARSKGIVNTPKGKHLITKNDIDIDEYLKKEKEKKDKENRLKLKAAEREQILIEEASKLPQSSEKYTNSKKSLTSSPKNKVTNINKKNTLNQSTDTKNNTTVKPKVVSNSSTIKTTPIKPKVVSNSSTIKTPIKPKVVSNSSTIKTPVKPKDIVTNKNIK